MNTDLLIDKKIELLINIQTKSLQREIEDLKRVIVTLNDEVVNIKRQVRNVQMPIAEAPRAEARQDVKSEAKQEKLAPEAPRNQRIGDLQPGDVDLKTFFYFGNKA